jgi:hypothetical protein
MARIEVYVENMEGEPLDHDYNIIKVFDNLEMYNSDSSDWAKKNEFVGSIKDDGNGIIITMGSMKKPIEMNYQNAQELFILLAMHNTAKMEFKKSETIKTI